MSDMKTLYLVRHAKSSWDHPGLSDFHRPLMERGIAKSKHVIDALREKRVLPDLIFSSPAVRARETAVLFAKGLGYATDRIRHEAIIYDGDAESILELLFPLPDEVKSVMMVGHNPTITYMANIFVRPAIDDMPTSAVIAIEFPADHWEEIPLVRARKAFFFTPKLIS